MGRVVHFEIHAENPERAMAFYGAVFGWEFRKFGQFDYWTIATGKDGQGIDGGLTRRRGHNPPPASTAPLSSFVCVIDVADIDKAIAAALAAGGTEALPKNAIPGVGWSAYFKDPEANLFGIFQALPRQPSGGSSHA
ncbi:MAG: VOC family protein [Bauldia sp.]